MNLLKNSTQLTICCLLILLVFSTALTQEDTPEIIYTKVKNTVILVKTSDPINFDGKLDLSTEYSGIEPILFPASVNSVAKVYVKQCSGVMYFGFYVPEQFFLKNFVRIAAGPSYDSISAILFNPYNLTRKSSLDKSLYVEGKSFPVPNNGFLAKADTIHKTYWTCEIKANLSEFKINAGLLGQQLYMAFAVSDANEKVYYSRDFQGWHSPATYFNVKSIDSWGKVDKESLISNDEITKFNDDFISLYYLFNQANELLKEKKLAEALKKLELIVEYDSNFYFVAYTIADLLNKLEMYDKALEAVNKALKINPYLLEAKVMKGAILEKLGKLDEALIYFKLLCAEYPEESSFALQVGKIQVDLNLKIIEEAQKLSDEQKEAKLKHAKQYLIASRTWFDGLALKYLEDIKVLISIALIYNNANYDEHAKSYISIVEGIVDKDVYKSPGLLNYYCFLRDKTRASKLTEKCIKAAKIDRDNRYMEEVKLTEELEKEIEKLVDKIEKANERKSKRDELTKLKLAELDAQNKNGAYLKYSAFLFEHATEYKDANMFELFEKYMKLLYKLISNPKFPRRTMNGTIASEKILAEYMIASVCVEDYEGAAEAYEELKQAWHYTHSVNNNYIQSYAELVNYPEYWNEEQQLRKRDSEKNLPTVKILTEKGQITLELFEDDAPNAVKNFIYNIEKGIYKANRFSTIVKGLIVQAGKIEKPEGFIETKPNKRRFFAGTLAMVNDPDVKVSESTEFFITLHAIPWLNNERTVFGRVIEGMDVVCALEADDDIYSIDVLNKRKDTKYVPKYTKKSE